jgi:hypothetical protein
MQQLQQPRSRFILWFFPSLGYSGSRQPHPDGCTEESWSDQVRSDRISQPNQGILRVSIWVTILQVA